MAANKIKNEGIDPYSIIKYPIATEKSIRLIESDNILVFFVEKKTK